MRSLSILLTAIIVAVAAVGCGGSPGRDIASQLAERQENRARSIQLHQRASAADRRGDSEQAAELLSEAVVVDERNAAAWMALGVKQYERDNLFAAAAAFHRAARLEPRRYEPHYNIGIILESAGRFAKAIDEYEAALKLAPGQLEVMENLARCYIREGDNLSEVGRLIDRALTIETRDDWLHWLEQQAAQLSRQNSFAHDRSVTKENNQ